MQLVFLKVHVKCGVWFMAQCSRLPLFNWNEPPWWKKKYELIRMTGQQ
jgi:hypothetical protein